MRRILFFVAIALIITSMWLGLTTGLIKGPKANPESPVRNILYVHVPSSISALLCFTILMVASIGYLKTGKDSFDRVAVASAEVGLVFATLLNATGSIFSRAEWGVWWVVGSWRLMSSAILWFLYVAYLILRSSLPGSKQRRARNCAVFGIIAFLDVPLVLISARMMEDVAHKPNVEFGSADQMLPFFMGMFAMAFLACLLIWLKTDVLKTRAMLEDD